MYLCICLSIDRYIYRFYLTYLSYLSILLIYLSTYLPIYLATHLPIHLSTYLPSYPSNYLPIHLSTYLPSYPSTYLPIHLSTYLPIYLSMYLCMHVGYIAWGLKKTTNTSHYWRDLHQAASCSDAGPTWPGRLSWGNPVIAEGHSWEWHWKI